MTFRQVNIGNIVCLDHYPFKPFRVIAKGDKVVLQCNTPVITIRSFTPEDFDAEGYKLAPIVIEASFDNGPFFQVGTFEPA